ncbi:MAG: CGNR zinc finger domain-containing protein [Steroidobacteraceae bacterium]
MAGIAKPSLVPDELRLLHQFANSLDLRRFVQGGAAHELRDELATPAALEAWMRERGLLERGVRLGRSDHEKALELRGALRAFLGIAPAERAAAAGARLSAAAADFALVVEASQKGRMRLQPLPRNALSGLGAVLADLHHAAECGNLDRLKVCASDECQRVFFDRSKPATRRWCSSALCGNREKTRAYRTRQRADA